MEDVLQQPAAITIVLSRYNNHHRNTTNTIAIYQEWYNNRDTMKRDRNMWIAMKLQCNIPDRDRAIARQQSRLPKVRRGKPFYNNR